MPHNADTARRVPTKIPFKKQKNLIGGFAPEPPQKTENQNSEPQNYWEKKRAQRNPTKMSSMAGMFQFRFAARA